MTNQFKDSQGKWRTQGLFLETTYDTDALYTLSDDDKEYKGKTYLSMKRLYIEMEDTTEYEFANKYFGGWNHWKRLRGNKNLRKHIDEAKAELELKLMAKGIKQIIDHSKSDKGYQAAKWLADRGWDTRKAGRPSKDEVEGELKRQAREDDEYSADILRFK